MLKPRVSGLSAPEILGHRAACGGRPAGCSRASLAEEPASLLVGANSASRRCRQSAAGRIW